MYSLGTAPIGTSPNLNTAVWSNFRSTDPLTAGELRTLVSLAQNVIKQSLVKVPMSVSLTVKAQHIQCSHGWTCKGLILRHGSSVPLQGQN